MCKTKMLTDDDFYSRALFIDGCKNFLVHIDFVYIIWRLRHTFLVKS